MLDITYAYSWQLTVEDCDITVCDTMFGICRLDCLIEVVAMRHPCRLIGRALCVQQSALPLGQTILFSCSPLCSDVSQSLPCQLVTLLSN